jgi:hypothetical protein
MAALIWLVKKRAISEAADASAASRVLPRPRWAMYSPSGKTVRIAVGEAAQGAGVVGTVAQERKTSVMKTLCLRSLNNVKCRPQEFF